jgi:hypothetical protein
LRFTQTVQRINAVFEKRLARIDQEMGEARKTLSACVVDDRDVAVCMSQHPRLGGVCQLASLPDDILRSVVVMTM